MADALRVQVSYALPDRQVVHDLSIAAGTTVQQAIEQSGILQKFPEIDLAQNRVGIFGKVKALNDVLRGRDRVEIYRPLNADAKEARRRRLGKK